MTLLGAGAVSFVVAGVVAAGPATADKGGSSDAPPGHNATIKINNIPFDGGVENEPHVTCPFQLSLYNFDSGSGVSNSAAVVFQAQPPSGNFQDVKTTEDPDAQTFTFPGPDTTKQYTFSQDALSTLTLQPQQGYHIKVTVSVTTTGATHPGNGNANANGNANSKTTRKHKVFWLTCAASSTAPSTPPSTPPSTQPATQVSSSPAVQPTQTTTASPQVQVTPTPSTSVLGEKVTRKLPHKPPKAKVKAVKVSKLPFTGVSAATLGVYVPAGLGLIFTGCGLVGLARRTRVHPRV